MGGEHSTHPGLGARVASPCCRRADAENLRGIRQRETLPDDEREDFAVGLGESREGVNGDVVIASCTELGRDMELAPETLGETNPTDRTATVGLQDSVGDAVRPRALLRSVDGERVPATPQYEQRFAETIGGIFSGADPTTEEGEQLGRYGSHEHGEPITIFRLAQARRRSRCCSRFVAHSSRPSRPSQADSPYPASTSVRSPAAAPRATSWSRSTTPPPSCATIDG